MTKQVLNTIAEIMSQSYHNLHLKSMNYQRLKSLYANDPDMLRALELREQTDLLKTIASKNEVTMKGAEMIKGDKGDTPVKGVDYLTDEELAQIKAQSTPIKGEDYFTPEEIGDISTMAADMARPVKGVDYVDGKDADETKIVKRLRAFIPSTEEIVATIKIPQPTPIDTDVIIRSVLSKIPKIKPTTVEDVIKELKAKKLLELKDIKGARLDMNDQRYHGGGLTSVSHDNTLTGQGTASSPLSVVSAAAIFYNDTVSGIIDGVNKTFTVPNTIVYPISLLLANSAYQAGVDYTTSGVTITFVVAPDISLSGQPFWLAHN